MRWLALAMVLVAGAAGAQAKRAGGSCTVCVFDGGVAFDPTSPQVITGGWGFALPVVLDGGATSNGPVTVNGDAGVAGNARIGGTLNVFGAAAFNGQIVNAVGTPSTATDAANKGYVDTAVAGAPGFDPTAPRVISGAYGFTKPVILDGGATLNADLTVNGDGGVAGNALVGGTLSTATITTPTATPLALSSSVADGSSAVGISLNTTATLLNSSAQLARIQDHGVTRAYWDTNGTYFGGLSPTGFQTSGISTPVNGTFSATTGTLNNGTYCYRVSATSPAGATNGSSETCLTVSGGAGSNGVVISWSPVLGATGYDIFGRTSTTEQYLASTTNSNTVTFTDTGSLTPVLPSVNSVGGTSSSILIRNNSRYESYLHDGVTVTPLLWLDGSDSLFLQGAGGAAFRLSTSLGSYCNQAMTFGAATFLSATIAAVATSGSSPALLAKANVASPAADMMQVMDSGGTERAGIDAKTGHLFLDMTDASASPGAATINKSRGQVSVAAGANSVVITDSVVAATSVVIPIMQGVDATCLEALNAVPSAGNVTINMNAACTGATKVGFVVF